ncbi:CPBP family intramembrane glutamic endopeptidase [Kribbella monticola]|uniref:CPBP family intramembrane glutamic endopeptidase n=1 Tax=Kribbella monticola TaxID=2185285 RepID=UPI000DD36977|nr:type II CAAX endopeptidase family protein [Kribbella monticola]
MFLRVVVFYLTTMLFSGVLNAVQAGTGPSPDLIQLVQFAPALAVGVMFLLFRRTTPVQARFTPPALVAGRSALIVAIVVATMLASIGVHVVAGHPIHGWWSDGLHFPFWALVLTMTVGAAGEELGWRAYLQPYLQTRFSVLRSSLIVGLLWGFWHIGGFEHGLVYMGLFVVMAVAISVVIGAVLQIAGGANLAVATAAHAAINLGLLLLFDEENGDKFALGTLAAVWVVAATVTQRLVRPAAVSWGGPPRPNAWASGTGRGGGEVRL